MTPELAPYVILMEAFVQSRLHASEFEAIYLRLFKNDPTMWPREIFEPLNGLFGDADAYSPDSSLREEHDLDGHQLQERARKTLEELRNAIDFI